MSHISKSANERKKGRKNNKERKKRKKERKKERRARGENEKHMHYPETLFLRPIHLSCLHKEKKKKEKKERKIERRRRRRRGKEETGEKEAEAAVIACTLHRLGTMDRAALLFYVMFLKNVRNKNKNNRD